MSLLEKKDVNDGAFPSSGISATTVLNKIDEIKNQLPSQTYGHFGLYAMEGKDSIQEFGEQAYRKFIRMNTVFSSILKGLALIEDDLQAMCVEIHNGGLEGRANITSGGSESIYCALHAMRERAKTRLPNISLPEVIVPYSAHIAFSRGAHFLGIKLVRVPTANNYRADLTEIERAIGPSTIGIAASAPCWPYDLFDPISEIGQIAISRNLWFHVDACVGGFLAPFVRDAGYSIPEYDFAVEGVNSISADLHKYGYSPKPCSSILWRSEREQQFHYCPGSDWPMGPYLTQSMLGSGPAGATVAAWAVLNHLGRDGYIEIADKMMKTKEKIIDGIANIDGISTLHSDTATVMIVSDVFDIQQLTAGMAEIGWVLWGNNEPPLIHLTVDIATDETINLFVSDLKKVTRSLFEGKKHPVPESSVYGTGISDESDQLPRWSHNAWRLIDSRS